jgi:hypothetical protein
MYVIKAALSNQERPGAAPVSVSFPVQYYEAIYYKLEAAGIGSATARDCRIDGIDSSFTALSMLCGQTVNVDELDYLAKRLDSFIQPEASQFEGMAAAKGITDIEGLINLTFCCQQATVITDFSDLDAIGKTHYIHTHGGFAALSELQALDARRAAQGLIESGTGTVTPHGVVYDNGMKLERLYTGREFPAYVYEPCVLTAEVKNKSAPDEKAAFLCLPMPEVCLKRALERSGIEDPDDAVFELNFVDTSLDISPDESLALFRWCMPEKETLSGLNAVAKAVSALDQERIAKIQAAAEYIRPGNFADICRLAERIDMFEFFPGVSTAEEYGRYMVSDGAFFPDGAGLEKFFDFEGYGKWLMKDVQGGFTESGYIRYDGDVPLEVLFPQREEMSGPEMKMGGM